MIAKPPLWELDTVKLSPSQEDRMNLKPRIASRRYLR